MITMKKITYIITFILLVVTTSCNEWLTIEPENELIKEEYWKSKEDVQGVLSASYGALRNTTSDIFRWAEIRGGDLAPGGSPTDDQVDMFDFNITEENTLVKWNTFYAAINYTNTVLKFAPQVVDIDPTFSLNDLKVAEAEATFIRSLSYFYLVKTFRDVPFVLEPYVDDNQEFTIAKTPEAEIITRIISDLEEVRQFAPESFNREDYAEKHDKGRATQYAIDALLADIYLWDNQYDKSIEACNRVINSYKFGLLETMEYFFLYSPGNSFESIFEIQSDKSLGQTNKLFELTANFTGGSQDFIVSEYFTEKFGHGDSRGMGVSFDPSNGSIWKYIGYQPFNTENARDAASQSDANWIVYRLAEIYLMRAEANYELQNLGAVKADLNIIRGRAGIDTDIEIDDSELLTTIIDERSKEFIGEGKRWFDLVRIARRDIASRKNIIMGAVLLNVSPQYFVAVKSKINDPDSWFLPIYENELKVNDLLEQNPFYKK